MPDIFGRNQNDYAHIRKLKERGRWEKECNDRAKAFGQLPHDFAAFGSAHGADDDAFSELEFMKGNSQAIQSCINEILYENARFIDYVPLVPWREIPEGARYYSYTVPDYSVCGRFVNLDTIGVPRVPVPQPISPPVYRGDLTVEWSRDDVRRAAFGEVPLSTRRIEDRTRYAANHLDEMVLTGGKGHLGLVNQPKDIVVREKMSQKYLDMEWRDKIEFVQGMINKFIESAPKIVGKFLKDGLTLYFSPSIFDDLKCTPASSSPSSKSVWERISTHNAWEAHTGNVPMIKPVAELSNPVGTGGDRCIVTLNNRDVMEIAVPMPRVILAEEIKGIDAIRISIEYNYSPLNLIQPKLIHYYDEPAQQLDHRLGFQI